MRTNPRKTYSTEELYPTTSSPVMKLMVKLSFGLVMAASIGLMVTAILSVIL